MFDCCASTRVVWNPEDYAAHSASQLVWARELMARLELRGDERILDVGCGDGKVTVELARAVPRGAVVGIDNSPEMIRFARKTFPADAVPNVEFHVADARDFHFADPFDVVFSNAALHWVDDHRAFLRCAARAIKPGGLLIVSCGGKGNAHDVFLALRSEMRQARWKRFFRRMPRPYFFYEPADYRQWLMRHGFEVRRIGLVARQAVHTGAEGLAGWLRTTWMPYTHRVPENDREQFIAAVVERYLAKHPPDAAGRVHVRMVRLEIEAVRTAKGAARLVSC